MTDHAETTTSDGRPDPEALLRQVQDESRRALRGKLRVFFGMAPGVGNTYTMLQAARKLSAEGVDVVIGLIETHKRPETEGLLLGLDILPRRTVEYRGVALTEFDLGAALVRKPEILVVDELAHTNAPGSKNSRRWQDVEELLTAGITVYTTLNVQHVDSLNDVIAQVTGVTVRETVPDSVLEGADEVELIDLPADALLERLREGKVYVPESAREAQANFFRRGNLAALRELALRRTAEWVDSRMQEIKREEGVHRVWPAGERLLVLVGPSPTSATLLRAAKRMSIGLRAELIALYVETPSASGLPEAVRARVATTLALAESLGAETVTIRARSVARAAVDYARSRNAGKIVVGKPGTMNWLDRLRGSPVDRLIRQSGEIDVFVVRGEGASESEPTSRAFPELRRTSPWSAYAGALGLVGVCSALSGAAFGRLELANVVMIYLLGVLVVASWLGRGPAVLAAVLSVAAFDFFFVPPQLTFAISDIQYLITFGVLLLVGLVVSHLTGRVREEARASAEREQRTAALYSMTRELAASRDLGDIVSAAGRHLRETFDSSIAIFLPAPGAGLSLAPGDAAAASPEPSDLGVVQWAFDNARPAGLGTTTLPSAKVLALPLAGSEGKVGVLVARRHAEGPFPPSQAHLLETFAHQVALAIERGRLIEDRQRATLEAQTERLRSALLSSVSHDLRTPLAVITGTLSALKEGHLPPEEPAARELVASAYQEANRLNELIGNLLFATRLEAGGIDLRREWLSVEELVGSALSHATDRLAGRPLQVSIPRDLPLLRADGALMEQLLINLLENAGKHTPAGTEVEVSAWKTDRAVVIQVADRGPGLHLGEEKLVFDRFYRGQTPGGPAGLGLGLSICRGIAKAHGGRIWAENRAGGGVAFRVSLPLEPQPLPPPAEEQVGPAPVPTSEATS